MEFGEHLKATRLQQHLTQANVADALHVSRQTISSWETSKSYPDIDSLLALSNFYQLSLDTLLKPNSEMVATLRKPVVFKALQPAIRQLTIANYLALGVMVFADQLTSVSGIFFVVAILNYLALTRMQKFASSLIWTDPYVRWQQRRIWIVLVAALATAGAIWSWVTQPNALASDFTLLAVANWGLIFYAEVGHFKEFGSVQS